MHYGLAAASEGLPLDLRPAFGAHVARSDWAGAIRLLLSEVERRTDVSERVACCLQAATLFEQLFGNSAEAQRILEYVLGLSPHDPVAVARLRELYTLARRQDKLRLLAENPRQLAANATLPKVPEARGADVAKDTGGPLAKFAAGGLFIGLPAAVTVTSVLVDASAGPHDNGGGYFWWFAFAILDVVFCAVFVAVVWLPARWALRRVGENPVLIMLVLLSGTFLIGMLPTLGWNVVDAANVLLDPSEPSPVRVRVVEHVTWGKARHRLPVVEERSGRSGPTRLHTTLPLEPVGSEHTLLRGEGLLGRPYYLRPQ